MYLGSLIKGRGIGTNRTPSHVDPSLGSGRTRTAAENGEIGYVASFHLRVILPARLNGR